MKLLVLAVGQRMPAWIDAGFETYAKRIPPEAGMRLVALRAEPRSEGTPVERILRSEAKRIRAALPDGYLKVFLDERGTSCSTRELARRMGDWRMEGRDVAFVIGGPDGLATELRREADWLWSLSPLTLPHALVRVVLAEQLYRAISLLKGHPYHRE